VLGVFSQRWGNKMNKPKCGVSRYTFPTDEQRKKLIEGALEFADLLPPGPDRARFFEVARSLSFLADSALHKDDDPASRQSTSHRDRPFSIVRGPDNTVKISMTPAVLHEIQQRAHKENVSLGQAIATLVKRAIKSDLIGLH